MKQILCLVTLSLLLVGCASTSSRKSIDTENLHDLEQLSMQGLTQNSHSIAKIRGQALKDTALTIGAQGGLSRRAGQIDAMLTLNKKELSQIFNFRGLMLDNNILPPVLEQSKQSLNLASPEIIRLTDRTYKIVSQARFVTAPPTWRSYLYMDYKKPELPDRTLLPRDNQERQLWIQYINIGWKQGIQQANEIFSYNLAALQRDYKGMILYRQLLAQNMVSKPFVAKSNMGITSNSDESLIRINDQILRITSKPKLYSNSKKWKPVIIQQ